MWPRRIGAPFTACDAGSRPARPRIDGNMLRGAIRQMKSDEHGRSEPGRQPLDHALEEYDAASGRSYDNDVEPGHCRCGPLFNRC